MSCQGVKQRFGYRFDQTLESKPVWVLLKVFIFGNWNQFKAFFSKWIAMKLKSPSKYTFLTATIASNYCSEGKKTWGFEIRCIPHWFYEKTHKRERSGEPMHVTFVVSWPTFFDENQKYKKIYGLVHDCFNYHKRWTYKHFCWNMKRWKVI